jgi:hypothetical protein
LSSTTDRQEQRGQIIVLFAGALVTLFIVAALAFDVGAMVLERRDQQNAADAAALAGARYAPSSATGTTDCASISGGAPLPTSPLATAWAACHVALENQSGDDETVLVHVPPLHGVYRGFPDFVEVQIQSTRSSVFGGIIGKAAWPVGVTAVAANQRGVAYSFGMLALNATQCKAILVSGTGTVNSAANVQANSTGEDCGDGSNIGFSRTGAGVLNVTAPDAVCRSGGVIQDQGAGSMTCTPSEFSFALPDPLRDLPAPAKPGLAAAMKEVVAGAVVNNPTNVPDYCPGAVGTKKPSEATPHTCVLGQGGGQANRLWILSPGLYPGGLDLKGGVTAYLLPGIYWIGGGGFASSNDASVVSVNSETDRANAVCTPGATPPCVGGGGILIYNSKLPTSPAGPITLGGGGATLSLQPFDYPFGTSTIRLVIFQDRQVSLAGDDITLNGSSAAATEVRGIVYAPAGDVKINGSSSVFSVDQVIASTFKINGSGGVVNVLRETGVDALISAVGLVE